jgi:alternate signal-mediated exported protein
MNKMVKGSLIGATGIVLLTGGFGTYALWQDSATLGSSTITSGTLDIAASSATWADASATKDDATWSPASDLMVPGDVVRRTQVFTLTGTGKNLAGKVTLTKGALSNTFSNQLTVDFDVTSDDIDVVENGTTNEFSFNEPFDTAQLTAVVTYTFSPNATQQAAQNATATLADSTITIAQTR